MFIGNQITSKAPSSSFPHQTDVLAQEHKARLDVIKREAKVQEMKGKVRAGIVSGAKKLPKSSKERDLP